MKKKELKKLIKSEVKKAIEFEIQNSTDTITELVKALANTRLRRASHHLEDAMIGSLDNITKYIIRSLNDPLFLLIEEKRTSEKINLSIMSDKQLETIEDEIRASDDFNRRDCGTFFTRQRIEGILRRAMAKIIPPRATIAKFTTDKNKE